MINQQRSTLWLPCSCAYIARPTGRRHHGVLQDEVGGGPGIAGRMSVTRVRSAFSLPRSAEEAAEHARFGETSASVSPTLGEHGFVVAPPRLTSPGSHSEGNQGSVQSLQHQTFVLVLGQPRSHCTILRYSANVGERGILRSWTSALRSSEKIVSRSGHLADVPLTSCLLPWRPC